jgi:AraC family transcriptional regulator
METHCRFVRYQSELLTRQPDAYPGLIGRVTDLLCRQLDRRLTLIQLGMLLGRSPWHLNLTFRQQTGLSIHEYATAIRMNEAAAAIRGGQKIEAIALSVGYRSAKSLYRQFERFFGITPASIRRSTRPGRVRAPSAA